jgi:hypothetical protein
VNEHQRLVLEFCAEHRLVLGAHIAALLEPTPEDADALLAELTSRGLVRRHQSHRRPSHYQITSRGLHAIDSPLPEPRIETLRGHRHDTSAPWLTLAAYKQAFGPYTHALPERVTRHQDTHHTTNPPQPSTQQPQPDQPPWGVVLNTGLAGTARRHYPDLMLTVAHGRVAIELQLRPAGADRLTNQITSYAADPQIAGVLYLSELKQVADTINHIIAQLGVQTRIHFRYFSLESRTPGDS